MICIDVREFCIRIVELQPASLGLPEILAYIILLLDLEKSQLNWDRTFLLPNISTSTLRLRFMVTMLQVNIFHFPITILLFLARFYGSSKLIARF